MREPQNSKDTTILLRQTCQNERLAFTSSKTSTTTLMRAWGSEIMRRPTRAALLSGGTETVGIARHRCTPCVAFLICNCGAKQDMSLS